MVFSQVKLTLKTFKNTQMKVVNLTEVDIL